MTRRLRPPKLAALDLDGTLVDTLPDLTFCIDEMLLGLGLEPAGQERVRGWVGRGVDELVLSALAARVDGPATNAFFAGARAAFVELYAAHASDRSRVYPGVREGIEFLRSLPAKLACVTNKATVHTERVLEDLGLLAAFHLVVSGDTLAQKKPSPAPLLYAAEQLAVPPLDSVLIGDSPTDIEAARRARFMIICVSYGYGAASCIRQGDPDAVIDSLAELPDLFELPLGSAG